jgi:hypothetical protein
VSLSVGHGPLRRERLVGWFMVNGRDYVHGAASHAGKVFCGEGSGGLLVGSVGSERGE